MNEQLFYYHVCNDYSLESFATSDTLKGDVTWKNGGKINTSAIELGWVDDELVYLRTPSDRDLNGRYV